MGSLNFSLPEFEPGSTRVFATEHAGAYRQLTEPAGATQEYLPRGLGLRTIM